MALSELADASGLLSLVTKSVSSVFDELNLSTEAWVEKSKLLTIGRERYARFIIENVGTFPLFATSRFVMVTDTYINVKLSTELARERYKSVKQIEDYLLAQKSGGEDERRSPQKPSYGPFEAMDSTDTGFALIGSAGSGKTTAFRYLAVELARGRALRGKRRIPIYFAVRDLAARQASLSSGALSFLRLVGVNEVKRVYFSLLESGRIALLVDGLDETSGPHQQRILDDLLLLRSRYPDMVICVSARPYSLSVGLPGFTKWETLPLSISERVSFVKTWFASVEPQKGERLLFECQGKPEMLDLGTSPLLLSIVCALYHNDLDLPSDPDELFARCVEGLLGGWDAFRRIARESPIGTLSVRRRIVLLSWIAANLFEEGKLVFSAADLRRTGCLRRIAAAVRKELPEEEELLRTLDNDFGILVERSPGLYSFSHLTLHEYLTALYVVDNREEDQLLLKRLADSEWFGVIRLTGKMLAAGGPFLRRLFRSVRLTNLYEVELLQAVLEVKPICTPEVYRNAMTDFAKRVEQVVHQTAVHIDRKESVLIVEIRNREPWDIGRTLPKLIEIIASAGMKPQELGCKAGGTIATILDHLRRSSQIAFVAKYDRQ